MASRAQAIARGHRSGSVWGPQAEPPVIDPVRDPGGHGHSLRGQVLLAGKGPGFRLGGQGFRRGGKASAWGAKASAWGEPRPRPGEPRPPTGKCLASSVRGLIAAPCLARRSIEPREAGSHRLMPEKGLCFLLRAALRVAQASGWMAVASRAARLGSPLASPIWRLALRRWSS